MANKTGTELKAQFEGTDPTNQNDDLIDYIDEIGRSYGELICDGGSTAQSLTGTTEDTLDCWTANGPSSSDVTPDYTTGDDITVANAGKYLAIANFSMSSDTNLPVMNFRFAVDGTSEGPGCDRKIATGADVGAAGMAHILDLAAGEAVSVNVTSSLSIDLTITEASLILHRIA